MHTQSTHYPLTLTVKTPEKCLSSTSRKGVKFQKNRYKTVGGDAHTRYPLSFHFDSKNVRKMTKFKLQKK